MISKTTVIQSNTYNPFYNLALEEYLLETIEKDECIMYLWQNEHTVVIGKNQNAWAQCNISLLKADGGYLARRSSGGGAVYHDLGNLNFTFIANNQDYNISKQLDVIISALKSFGINAEKTGRNDITVDGRKISGNAFHKGNTASCHHGTLLINSNMEALAKYLNVSEKKLKSKGVDSVRSRVINIGELTSASIPQIKTALINAFSDVYGIAANETSIQSLNQNEIALKAEKYSSDEWRLGQNREFEFIFEDRFTWGEISVCLDVSNSIITACSVYSDALHVEFIENLKLALLNTEFDKQKMLAALHQKMHGEAEKTQDVINLLNKQNI